MDDYKVLYQSHGCDWLYGYAESLGEAILDRDGIADTMRHNLASDIVNGRYGLSSVTRQMIAIEDYEETTSRMRTRMKEV